MGAGIQQAPVAQDGGSNPLFDVVKVLYEPGAVFERVRARPSFFAPFLTIVVVQCVLFFLNLSYLKAAVAAQIAAQPQAQGRPLPGTALLVIFGLLGLVIVLGIVLLVSGLLLYVIASMVGGGEAKFSTLLSVAVYAAVPSTIVLSIVGLIVLHMQGTASLTSPQDLQPALGLDLLSPGMKGFVGSLMKAINPFSLWGLVLTAIGVSTTQRVSKGTGYTVATIAFVIGLLIAGGLGAIFNR